MATQIMPDTSSRANADGLAQQGISPSGHVHWNLNAPELVESAIRRGEGRFAKHGPFVAVTSPHTGRSPNDKFVVRQPDSEADVDWGKVNQPISEEHFDAAARRRAELPEHAPRSCSSRTCTAERILIRA
jgi:phosphoenolpyruvate carboxykinase (ATP)